MTTSPIASLAMVNLDCAAPSALAAFYGQILGWEVTHNEDAYALISDATTSIGFGLVDGYEPPAWPDGGSAKRFHLDFYVDSLESAELACVELGANVAEFQPGGERWRVLIDPGGHPFCICAKSPPAE